MGSWFDKTSFAKRKKKHQDTGWSSDDYYDSVYGSSSKKEEKKTSYGTQGSLYGSYGSGNYGTGGGSRDYGYGSNYGSGYSSYGYGSSYGSGYGRKSGGFSWGSWGWDDNTDVDESELKSFVRSHDSYMTPKNTSIKIKEFVNDTEVNRTFIKEMSRFFYHKMIMNKEFVQDEFLDETRIAEDKLPYFQQKKSFYDALWDKEVPGFSPLEKAQLIFDEMLKKNDPKKKMNLAEAEDLEETLSEITFHDEIINDPIFNELMEMNDHAKRNKYRIFELISYIQHLGAEFKIEKEIEEKIVPNSHLIAKKILRDYNQIYRMDLYQRIFPNYRLNLIQKNLIINAPIEKTEHKQKIIMLLDFSGSMNYDVKQDWVVALMMDRLKYAMKEECELFFSYFVHDTKALHFHHVYNKKTALEFWSKFSTDPNGGDTRIGDMVNYIEKEIKLKRLHNLKIDLSEDKPEILIVNDGQDTVKTSKFPYKCNAITLVDSENPELKRLCLQTEGKYIYINDYEIKKYNKTSCLTEKIKK